MGWMQRNRRGMRRAGSIACAALLAASFATARGQIAHTGSGPAAVAPSNDSDSTLALAADLLSLDGPELPQRGFNASLALSGLHDSQLGWAGYAQPAVSYRFNQRFSLDATIPIYFYRNGYKYRPIVTNERLSSHIGELGDTTLAGHAQYSPGWLDYTGTAAFNLPTGDKTYGLSTGRVTYVANNDFETSLGRLTPDIQLGIGDNSDLVNRRVQRNYDTLGLLAYFQAGGEYALPWNWSIESDAYEQLPLGHQKLYTNVLRRRRHLILPANSDAEDNGVTVSLDSSPLRHVQVSSYYNRSFRLADDTVGLTFTFELRTPKPTPPPQL